MLDIGWYEIFVVAVITVIVVGPKELPRVLRTVTQVTRKLRSMASEFQSSIDDIAKEAELDDLKKSIDDMASGDLESELENAIDPTGEFTESVREIGDSVKEDPAGDNNIFADAAPEPPTVSTDVAVAGEKPAKRAPAKRKSPSKKKPRSTVAKRKAGDSA